MHASGCYCAAQPELLTMVYHKWIYPLLYLLSACLLVSAAPIRWSLQKAGPSGGHDATTVSRFHNAGLISQLPRVLPQALCVWNSLKENCGTWIGLETRCDTGRSASTGPGQRAKSPPESCCGRVSNAPAMVSSPARAETTDKLGASLPTLGGGGLQCWKAERAIWALVWKCLTLPSTCSRLGWHIRVPRGQTSRQLGRARRCQRGALCHGLSGGA